jgi:hypothetical protein
MSAVRDRIRVAVGYGAQGAWRVGCPDSAWPLRSGRAGACFWTVVCLPGGTGEVGGDDVGGVPVQAAAGAVVAHRGARVGVRGGFLHVAERDPGVQRGGDERVPQRAARPAY